MLFSPLILILLGTATTCAIDISNQPHERAAVAAAPPPPAPRPAPPAPAPKPPSPPLNPSRPNPPKPKPDDDPEHKPDAPDSPDGPDDSTSTKTNLFVGWQPSASAVRPNTLKTTSTSRPYIQTSSPTTSSRRSATSTISSPRTVITLSSGSGKELVDMQFIAGFPILVAMLI